MILDTIEQKSRYAALNDHFKKAVDFIQRNDLPALPPDKYPIDGNNVWATITEGLLKDKADAKLEAHDRYIDIQITLQGTETYGWRARGACRQANSDYNAEKDILFFHDASTAFVTLNEGEFVVFFPQDAHQPMIGEGPIKKCVIKIKA